ncbi:hypothetical protein N7475_005573 [Penicillium sp. IBT 31633x]|nr:hypothetical protein N7475_005573 [Penicillium sp. IBT 31633x]
MPLPLILFLKMSITDRKTNWQRWNSITTGAWKSSKASSKIKATPWHSLKPLSDTMSPSADYISYCGDQVPPQVYEYFLMVGEARTPEKRLSELEGEQHALIRQQRGGIPLNNAAIDFLHRYPDEKAKIVSELETACHKVDSHKMLCTDCRGII